MEGGRRWPHQGFDFRAEACGGAHYLARALRGQGHDARLMPAQYVKPYVKTNKNDYLGAEAIAEAVQRPTMRFVPIKNDEQLDLQALHCVRDRWVPCGVVQSPIAA
jgi:transposase